MKIDFPLSYWTLLFFVANRDALSVPPFSPSVPPRITDPLFNQYWPLVSPWTILDPFRAKRVWDLALEAKDLEGDFIECGSHQGGLSFLLAFFIRHFGLSKKIYLCDSFEGLPEPDPQLDSIFKKGILSSNYERCLEFIETHQLGSIAVIKKGWFEKTLADFKPPQKFSLIHIDCDLYQSTRTCFQTLYPLASPHAPIILDDYNIPSPGERKATKEQIALTHEGLELGPYSQAYLRKGTAPKTDTASLPDPEGHPLSYAELRENSDYCRFLKEVIANHRDQTENLSQLLEVLS